jgi:hypothetical protein
MCRAFGPLHLRATWFKTVSSSLGLDASAAVSQISGTASALSRVQNSVPPLFLEMPHRHEVWFAIGNAVRAAQRLVPQAAYSFWTARKACLPVAKHALIQRGS